MISTIKKIGYSVAALGTGALAWGMSIAHAAPLDAEDVGDMFTNVGETGFLDVVQDVLSTNLPLVLATVVAVFVIFLLIRIAMRLINRAAK